MGGALRAWVAEEAISHTRVLYAARLAIAKYHLCLLVSLHVPIAWACACGPIANMNLVT